MSRISKEFLPRSTKSPLNTYGFSVDGKPFWTVLRGKFDQIEHLGVASLFEMCGLCSLAYFIEYQ